MSSLWEITLQNIRKVATEIIRLKSQTMVYITTKCKTIHIEIAEPIFISIHNYTLSAIGDVIATRLSLKSDIFEDS